MSDWYTEGYNNLIEELMDVISSNLLDDGSYEQVAKSIYSFLSEIGLIDYDTEKEILWERYFGEEDE